MERGYVATAAAVASTLERIEIISCIIDGSLKTRWLIVGQGNFDKEHNLCSEVASKFDRTSPHYIPVLRGNAELTLSAPLAVSGIRLRGCL